MKKLMFPLLGLMLLASCSNEEIMSDADQTATNTRAAVNSGSPVDPVSGLINNDHFAIRMSTGDTISDKTYASENSIAITNALKWASENNIRNVKLQKGTYVTDARIGYGIKMSSNIDFDMNGATIQMASTSTLGYTLISTNNASNIKIRNGFLVGDRMTHDYSTPGVHENGEGLVVLGGENVEISNMDISEMAGDAVCLSPFCESTMLPNLKEGAVTPRNVKILDSKLHNCRRQGITISGVDGCDIAGNKIQSIGGTLNVTDKYGTAPQSCIDIESGFDWVVENIQIRNNYLQSNAGRGCIMYHRTQDILFDNNTLDRCGVSINFNRPPVDHDNGIKCTISNNTIIGNEDRDPLKAIGAGISADFYWDFKGKIDYVRIIGNKLEKAFIQTGGHESIKNIYILKNELNNSRIGLAKSSGQMVSGNVLKQSYILASDQKNTVFKGNTISNADSSVINNPQIFTVTRSENTVIYNNTIRNGYLYLSSPKRVAYFSNSFSTVSTTPYYALRLDWVGDPSEYYLYVMYNAVDGNYLGAEPNSINNITVNRNEIDCTNFVSSIERNFTNW